MRLPVGQRGADEGAAGAPHTVVCLPPAGASSAYYLGWRAHVPPGLVLVLPELPGRLSRFGEAPLASIGEMAGFVLEHLEREDRQGDLTLFGHSMGALVAFELARRIEAGSAAMGAAAMGQNGRLHLHVAGHVAPDAPRPALSALDSDEAVTRQFARLNGRPAPAELVALMLPTIRADLLAAAGYRAAAEPRLSAPIVAHGGQGDPTASPARLGGWRRFTLARFTQVAHPGDHHFPLARGAEILAAIAAAARPHGAAR